MNLAADSYPWYGEVDDGSLEQGDLLDNFPVVTVMPPFESLVEDGSPALQVEYGKIIILTQSCDLDASKVRSVLICPHLEFDLLAKQITGLGTPKERDRVRKGLIHSLYMIPPCEISGFEDGARVVSFRSLTTAPFELVTHVASASSRRVRLLPPYREQLAQSLARFLERVALPIDYPAP